MREDAPSISQLLDQLGWVVPPEDVVTGLSASPSTDVVVAELHDDVVGVVVITTQLVDVALEAAARNNAQAVEVVRALRRVKARRFYERLGFEVTANYFVRST